MINTVAICLTIAFCIVYGINKLCDCFKVIKYKDTDIITTFDYFLSKAYEMVYESDLITFVTNSVSPSSEERETIERNFIKSCLLYMGSRNEKMFIYFFGSKVTLIVNIVRYMRKRLNEDGLAKIIRQANEKQES